MTRIRFRVYYGSSSEAGLTMGQVLIPSYLIFTITWLHTRANKGPEKPSILPKVTQPGSPRTYKVLGFLTCPNNLSGTFLHQENSFS